MNRPALDPVFVSARREAIVAALIWAAATAWSVGYCALFGYGRTPESLTFVLWFPDWIFWGIVAPWLACVVVSMWFAFFFMRDEDLGSNDQDEDADPFQPQERGNGG
ncbi:MAG TPA: DUF997 family protein [Pirellulales bacterium]